MELQSDRDKVAHLLRRFGFGASEAELDYYAQDGLRGAIDRLLDPMSVEETAIPEITAFKNNNNTVNMPTVQAYWYLRMLTTQRPLVEKMTVFWHDHFATSAAKVNQASNMHLHVQTLRTGALGSFQELLFKVSKDPAMIFWLDNQLNVRGKANENFAREVMELFTLGIGHYSEKDVQEAARAFTGWSYRRQPRPPGMTDEEVNFRGAEYVFNRRAYDDGEKTVLGKTGRFTGEDVLEALAIHPQTARYLATKLWTFFVYPNPEPAVVERIAAAFVRSGLMIVPTLRAMIESPEFFSTRALRKVIKTPVDFTIPTMRQLGMGGAVKTALERDDARSVQVARGSVGAAQQANKAMGMDLMYPPDVAGWEWGHAWITSATMVERIAWADRLFGQVQAGSRRAQLNMPLSQLMTIDSSPAAFVDQLLSVFDAPLPPAKRPALVKAAEEAAEGSVNLRTANRVAGRVCRLIFGSPEFQFA